MLRFARFAKRQDRGDTIIEVLFAVTVFSMVAVGALALMNQGAATSQRALEMTLVTQQVEAQAETLRYLHESYVTNYQSGYATNTELDIEGPTGEFYEIVQNIRAADREQASEFLGLEQCATPPPGSFILNTRTGTFVEIPAVPVSAETYAQVVYEAANPAALARSEGVWIEGIRSPISVDPATSGAGYIDFHIRACWQAPGLSRPTTFGTIVRLYEPRG